MLSSVDSMNWAACIEQLGAGLWDSMGDKLNRFDNTHSCLLSYVKEGDDC